MHRARALHFSLALLALGATPLWQVQSAAARPERIRAGHSYYSDTSESNGLVQDIGAERNYEEVYQAYTYYEAVYDETERVATFREYRQGEVLRTETYRYAADGSLVERVVQRPGHRPEVTTLPARGDAADGGADR